MAKTLRTSQDYTIKAGDGAAGSHTITLDSNDVVVTGDLIVQGDQTTINTATLTIEDQFIEVAKNNSVGDQDSGVFFYRGGGANNPGILYYDASDDIFKIGTTNNSATVSEIDNLTLKNLQVAEPVTNSDVATKYYVDNQISSGSMSQFFIRDQAVSPATETVQQSDVIIFANGRNTTSEIVSTNTVKINLDTALTDVNSVTAETGSNLTLSADDTAGQFVIINNVLSFNAKISDPAFPGSITRLYAKTPAGGGTGVFFVNSDVNSGSAGELISKKKATALAIALG